MNTDFTFCSNNECVIKEECRRSYIPKGGKYFSVARWEPKIQSWIKTADGKGHINCEGFMEFNSKSEMKRVKVLSEER